MKAEDFGIDVETGQHDKRLTACESGFLGIMWEDHLGQDHAISALELAVRFQFARSGWRQPDHEELTNTIKNLGLRVLDEMKREVRRMHNHLLMDHDQIPMFSKSGSGGGYWIAASENEAKEFYASFRQRALTGMRKASRGSPRKMVEMVQQLSFEFHDFKDMTGSGVRAEAPSVVALEVVDSFLERMTAEPEKFAEGLRKIGRKYGSVLLPRGQVEAMLAKAKELEQLVESMAA